LIYLVVELEVYEHCYWNMILTATTMKTTMTTMTAPPWFQQRLSIDPAAESTTTAAAAAEAVFLLRPLLAVFPLLLWL